MKLSSIIDRVEVKVVEVKVEVKEEVAKVEDVDANEDITAVGVVEVPVEGREALLQVPSRSTHPVFAQSKKLYLVNPHNALAE